MKITLLAGTNRPGSNTRKVVTALETLYREAGAQPRVLDLAELPTEIFLPSSYAEKPAGFAVFSAQVLAAEGLHVVTPEYNGGAPGVLKYFIDMLPHPDSFAGRPVAFTGLAAGMWGALRPVEQLETLFGNLGAMVFPTRVFLPGINGLLAESGELKDAGSVKRLRSQVNGFLGFVKKLRA